MTLKLRIEQLEQRLRPRPWEHGWKEGLAEGFDWDGYARAWDAARLGTPEELAADLAQALTEPVPADTTGDPPFDYREFQRMLYRTLACDPPSWDALVEEAIRRR